MAAEKLVAREYTGVPLHMVTKNAVNQENPMGSNLDIRHFNAGGRQMLRFDRHGPVTSPEPTPITPVSFRCGFRVGASHQRRGSVGY
jgi:hypothetical protein